MNMKYAVDNVKNYAKTNGWICGHFIPEGSIQKNSQLEVKYEVLKPGSNYFSPHYHPQSTEVCLIIKGKVKWLLDGKDYLLKEGDFIFLQNNVTESLVEVYETTTLISVRTPSVPNNKVNVAK